MSKIYVFRDAWSWAVLCVLLSFGIASCQQRRVGHASYEMVRTMDRDNTEKDVLEFPDTVEPIQKSEGEWKELLGEFRYYVMRRKGTERAFTGQYWNHHADGWYVCAACGLPLFSSVDKFDSGTGWPSFTRPVREDYIGTERDTSYGMLRTEIHCARCGGHLGHVFDDGPPPTGLRYCVNSISLRFVPKERQQKKQGP